VNTSRKLRRRDADIRSAVAAAARRSVTIGGGGVSKMAAARRWRRTALVDNSKGIALVISKRDGQTLIITTVQMVDIIAQ